MVVDDDRAWRPWAEDMQWCAARRPEVAKPVWHCSLRAAPEDPVLSDEQWGRIAREHVAGMCLDGHPWVAVRHGDDHVHIVASRVDGHGRLWRDSHDYARAMTSVRRLEQRHGLAPLTGDRPVGVLAKTTASERERTARRNRHRGQPQQPERVQLRTRMLRARTGAARLGIDRWHSELDRAGVLYQPHTTSGGRIVGYRVSLPGWTDTTGAQVWLKASQVERSLGWASLRAHLGIDYPGGDQLPDPAAVAGRSFPAAAVAALAFPTTTAAEVTRAARLTRQPTGPAVTPTAIPRPRTTPSRDHDHDQGR